MRRQDIQLLANARQGDSAARCEVGRRYLLGVEGLPRHVALGLEYLSHPSIAGSERVSIIIAEALPLHEIVRLDQLNALRVAAAGGSNAAQLKLGLWTCLTRRDIPEARDWFQAAAQTGSVEARAALQALVQPPALARLGVLRAMSAHPGVDGPSLLLLALARAKREDDAELLAQALDCMLKLVPNATPELADCTCEVLTLARGLPSFHLDAPSERIERLLENCVLRGNADAALMLGRALCGVDEGPLPCNSLVTRQNMRKGAALLLRAADAGKDEAWMLLYRVHSDNRASVANPLMARFFLEKAAVGGSVTAQRRLGALTLRSACTLHESEQGIRWLHEAARGHDGHASRLLQSLVLPIAGAEGEASAAIDAIRREDPWTACRLRTARDFGLTKLEALSVDIPAGERPWGLVVGPNPFILQAKLSAPRAIPALTEAAARNLRRSAAFFEQARQDGAAPEGDLRKRSVRLRALLERHGANESMFLAEVRSTTLEALRLGTKWAFHVRQPLRMALVA